jgi:type VI secretion system protein ImpL
MTRILITALKIFLLLALAAAVGFGALLLADYQGWPRWIVGVAVAGVFFVVVLVLFVRRYYYRRREERFVKRVVDQDQKAIDAAPAHERRRLVELQERWATAVATLRSSRLRHRGDPLYSLPWFMIFGETGSGKSTAVSHARLSTILTEAGPTKGMASTRNCDWWFFENAVVLDTAGRYAVPLEDEDREEWERFLSLLAKYRRKEPLNGLVVTLPADRLLTDDTDALTSYGRAIRMRLDQLMRVLGAKFPVYVLITKLDLVMGMTALAELLPEQQRGQAMGMLNETDKLPPEDFLEQALGHIGRRLKELRLVLTSQAGTSGSRALLFPDELLRLAPRIRAFVNGAFHDNPYQETPFLRGLFISSGRQSGLTRSGVLGGLESFKERQWPLPETGLGLFLHDFFGAILPKDRSGFRMLGEFLSWRTATTNLALGAWLLLLLTGVGVASLSYFQIRQAMQPVAQSFAQPPEMGKDLAQDMVTMGLLRDQIARMEQQLRHGAWPRMGLNQGRSALAGLKSHYNQWFRQAILTPTDETMGEQFAKMGTDAQEDVMAPYLEYLVWRIDTLKARESGKPRPDTPGQDGPIQALALAFGGRLPYVAAFFPDMYRSYAQWEGDVGLLSRERQEMQVWANRIIEQEGRNLHWMVQWADSRQNLPDVTLADFWSGLGQVANEPEVSGAYTVQGKEEINKLLQQVVQAAEDPTRFSKRTTDFWNWYAVQFADQWKDFRDHFDLGMDKLLHREDWMKTSVSMTTTDNPYFNLIQRMQTEYKAIEGIRFDPTKVNRFHREFEYLIENYKAKQMKASLDQRISDKVKQLEAKVLRLEDSLAAADHFDTYMKQLKALNQIAATMDSAYRFASQSYGSTGDKQSPVDEAMSAVQTISNLLVKGEAADWRDFWHLVEGPLMYMVTLITYETACAVNELWESQVLSETASIPKHELWNALFGDKGVVSDFVDGPAKPFLQRTQDGWGPADWLNIPFPFQSEFLSFLDQGSVRRQQIQPKYTVPVSTLPTNVNPEAKSEPYQTTLTLQCVAKPQTLDNFNFPNSLDFVWEPNTCDDVNLRIYFREATLSQNWTGEWAFRDFLREFRAGRKVYEPKDFPQQKTILEGLDITRIQVNYTMKNVDPVLAIEDYPPLKVPRQATHCWAGLGIGQVRSTGASGATGNAQPASQGSAPNASSGASSDASSGASTGADGQDAASGAGQSGGAKPAAAAGGSGAAAETDPSNGASSGAPQEKAKDDAPKAGPNAAPGAGPNAAPGAGPAKDTAQDSGQDSVQDAAKEAGQDAAKEAAENKAKDALNGADNGVAKPSAPSVPRPAGLPASLDELSAPTGALP